MPPLTLPSHAVARAQRTVGPNRESGDLCRGSSSWRPRFLPPAPPCPRPWRPARPRGGWGHMLGLVRPPQRAVYAWTGNDGSHQRREDGHESRARHSSTCSISLDCNSPARGVGPAAPPPWRGAGTAAMAYDTTEAAGVVTPLGPALSARCEAAKRQGVRDESPCKGSRWRERRRHEAGKQARSGFSGTGHAPSRIPAVE